jgi:dynein heavy chain
MQLPDEAKKFGKTDTNFKKIMEASFKNQICFYNCVKADNGSRLDDLENISTELERCKKSLKNYLDSKANAFPRFYFISQDDLLQILGSSDPTSIQRFMLSLFDNCKSLVFANNNKVITGMISNEKEAWDFVFKVKPEGKIEEWMNDIDAEMKRSLEVLAKQSIWEYARQNRIEWIKKQIGMLALVGTQIWWTYSVQDVFQRVAKGDIHAMKNELAKQT